MDENTRFKALWVEEAEAGRFTRRVVERSVADLPPGDLLVRVQYSSLNYKDALSASGNRGVTKRYPHTPGIDAAGTVVSSASPAFQPGDAVIVMGHDLGSNTPGGYGQYIRVPAGWAIPLPEGLSLRDSMAYGTAGLTAAISVYRLEQHGVTPAQGEILVTGATGGVGVFAVALLARDGYTVVAATGKLEKAALLERLGARQVVHRDTVSDPSDRPLLSGRWAGAVDTVGGTYLATAIRATKPGGCVTCCGNAASPQLNLTVYPFILRGVNLQGVDMLTIPDDLRLNLWKKIAGEWKIDLSPDLFVDRSLEELDGEIERILHGGQTGRIVVDLDR